MTTPPVPSITDEQLAELEELDALRGLISRLRAAEADARRYRYLKDQGHFRAMSLDMGGNHTWAGMGRAVGKGPSVDSAIDTAMEHTP